MENLKKVGNFTYIIRTYDEYIYCAVVNNYSDRVIVDSIRFYGDCKVMFGSNDTINEFAHEKLVELCLNKIYSL